MPKKSDIKILIIDDDTILCSMYKTKLEADGFSVFASSDGSQGLQIARKENPDLIFLDIMMPQIDGFAILESLKKDEKTKNIPVVMLTNLGTDEDRDKGEKMGAIDYFVKANLTPAQVSDKIKDVLKVK